MTYQPISGYGRRCGFNSLVHFFFGVKDATDWEPSPVGSPLSLVVFSALLLEQKLLQNKTISPDGSLVRDTYNTGLQFYTMKTIVRAFSRYQGNDEWLPQETENIYCFHNSDFAVVTFRGNLRGGLHKTVKKIPSAVVFALYHDHWTVFYNGVTEVPIPEIGSKERRERVEFMVNLFINCVGSLAPGDAIANHILNEVMVEADRYSTPQRTDQGISPARYLWGIYTWIVKMRTALDIDVSEASQLVVSYQLVDPTISGFPINENYMSVLDPAFEENTAFTRNEKLVVEKIACDYTNLLSHKPVNRALFANRKPRDFNIEFYRRVSGVFTLLGTSGVVPKNGATGVVPKNGATGVVPKNGTAVSLDQALNNSSTQQTVDRFGHLRELYREIFGEIAAFSGEIGTWFNLRSTSGVTSGSTLETHFEKLVLFGCFETALSLYEASGGTIPFGNKPVSFLGARDRQGNPVVVEKTVACVLKAVTQGITIEM